MTDTHVYKILSASDWTEAEAAGVTGTALDKGDGYVHLSTRAQVAETLALHYAGQREVRLLEYALDGLGDVRWETSRGGQMFPHLYGDLLIADALRLWVLEPGADGAPVLPEDM